MRKLFIANRGEVAIRVIRAAHKLGIECVVGHSEADRGSLPTRLADAAICIGGPRSVDSYLDIDRVLSAALATGCDAIHPGYGFLSESPAFATACAENGIRFVGPPAQVVRTMGDKAAARAVASESGVPVLAGSPPLSSLADIDLSELPYPILLKAVAGGGGRGIRLAVDERSLREAFELGSREAAASFGDGRLYLENFIPRARHVEVQILADEFGNVVHLGERECSVQRRHQKVLEEAPAPIDDDVRRTIREAAVALARHLGYVNAGTVEFVLDEDEGTAWFIEMNTRLQVEHGVSEMVTEVDIVAQQLRIAAGLPLGFEQDDVVVSGHAIQWRITAESLADGLAPQPGRIERWAPPELPGIRIDSHCVDGYQVPPFYDSLLGKLMSHGRDRPEAIRRLRAAVDAFEVTGIPTTLDLCRHVLDREEFISGRVTTRWLDEVLPELQAEAAADGT